MPARVRRADDPSFTVTSTELARLLCTTAKEVTRLRLNGMPIKGKNQYSLADVFAWLQLEGGKGDGDDPSLTDAKRDLAVAQKAKVEIEVRKLHNELVPYEEVKHLMMGLVQVLSSGLEALPARTGARLAAMTSTAAAEDEIERECRYLREQLAASVGRFATDYLPISGTPGATPSPPRRPVGRRKKNATSGKSRAGAVAVE